MPAMLKVTASIAAPDAPIAAPRPAAPARAPAHRLRRPRRPLRRAAGTRRPTGSGRAVPASLPCWGRAARLCQLEQVLPERPPRAPTRDAKSVTITPSTSAKRAAAFRQRRGHQHRDVRVQRALILFQLRHPAVAPVPRVLALPESLPHRRPRESTTTWWRSAPRTPLPISTISSDGKPHAGSAPARSSPASPCGCWDPCSAFRLRSSICRRSSASWCSFSDVLQPMRLGQAFLRLGDDTPAFLVQLTRDGELQTPAAGVRARARACGAPTPCACASSSRSF